MPISPSGNKSCATKLQINIAIPPRIPARRTRPLITSVGLPASGTNCKLNLLHRRFEDVVKDFDGFNEGRGDSLTLSYGVVNQQIASQPTNGKMVLKVAEAPR